jgi:hypothetical protein
MRCTLPKANACACKITPRALLSIKAKACAIWLRRTESDRMQLDLANELNADVCLLGYSRRTSVNAADTLELVNLGLIGPRFAWSRICEIVRLLSC